MTKRTRKVFKPEELKPFADAICLGQNRETIMRQFNCAYATVNIYQKYASSYALALEKGLDTPEGRAIMIDANDTCRKQGTKIMPLIIQNIDNGLYYGNKKKITPRGPQTHARTSNPIKEEGPAAVQQKLPLQNPGCSEKRGPASRNDVDKKALMREALATFKETFRELCQTIRAI